jgi:hypothetical protein
LWYKEVQHKQAVASTTGISGEGATVSVAAASLQKKRSEHQDMRAVCGEILS